MQKVVNLAFVGDKVPLAACAGQTKAQAIDAKKRFPAAPELSQEYQPPPVIVLGQPFVQHYSPGLRDKGVNDAALYGGG